MTIKVIFLNCTSPSCKTLQTFPIAGKIKLALPVWFVRPFMIWTSTPKYFCKFTSLLPELMKFQFPEQAMFFPLDLGIFPAWSDSCLPPRCHLILLSSHCPITPHWSWMHQTCFVSGLLAFSLAWMFFPTNEVCLTPTCTLSSCAENQSEGDYIIPETYLEMQIRTFEVLGKPHYKTNV